jgi:ssDNA-binding Zn-finger/Zn-ribbon topoisomerase 1
VKPGTRTQPAWRLTADCPRCGSDLVVRRARHDHQPFVGCCNYPFCRFTCVYDVDLQECLSHQLEASAAERTHLERENRRLSAEVFRLEMARQDLTAQLARLSCPAHTHRLHDPDLARALTKIIAQAHPDRWVQGQPATALAHELTTALLALRAQIQQER